MAYTDIVSVFKIFHLKFIIWIFYISKTTKVMMFIHPHIYLSIYIFFKGLQVHPLSVRKMGGFELEQSHVIPLH